VITPFSISPDGSDLVADLSIDPALENVAEDVLLHELVGEVLRADFQRQTFAEEKPADRRVELSKRGRRRARKQHVGPVAAQTARARSGPLTGSPKESAARREIEVITLWVRLRGPPSIQCDGRRSETTTPRTIRAPGVGPAQGFAKGVT